MRFSCRADLETWLSGRGLFHVQLGLERVKRALKLLNLENPPFKRVQTLGSNGKGSTCVFLETLARLDGAKTGLFTSPHFVSPKERILVNGLEVSDEIWLYAANSVFAAYDDEPDLTYFEFLTVLALFIFRETAAEIAIMEAGLGGANDATSAIAYHARLYAPITLEHANVIGPTLSDIAKDKAAPMRDGAPTFSAPQFPAVREEFAKAGAPRYVVPVGKPPGWRGDFQRVNAALALAAWRRLRPESALDEKDLSAAFFPGRLQYAPPAAEFPAVLLDGCHNPGGALAVLAYLRSAPAPKALIFACLADKDWRTTLALLTRGLPPIPAYLPRLDNPRAENPKTVAAFLATLRDAPVLPLASSAEAFELAARDKSGDEAPILVTGSLYLLGEFYARYPSYLRRPDAANLRQNKRIKK